MFLELSIFIALSVIIILRVSPYSLFSIPGVISQSFEFKAGGSGGPLDFIVSIGHWSKHAIF